MINGDGSVNLSRSGTWLDAQMDTVDTDRHKTVRDLGCERT